MCRNGLKKQNIYFDEVLQFTDSLRTVTFAALI